MNRVGIVVALAAEGRSLTKKRLRQGKCLELDNGCLLALSNAGREAAERAALQLADAGVAGLISWGCAAALDPRLQPGDLVLPNQLLAADGSALSLASLWRARVDAVLAKHLPVAAGPIKESIEIVSTAAAKQALFAATGAVALDMESAAVARVATERGLPVLIVRSVVDPAELSIPPAIGSAFDATGKLRFWKLLSGLIQRPSDLPGVVRLGPHFRAAMQTLRRVNTLLGHELCRPD